MQADPLGGCCRLVEDAAQLAVGKMLRAVMSSIMR